MKELTLYCSSCGTKLVASVWYGSSYDTHTGERHKGIDYKCPNNAWWKFWHSEFELWSD